MIGFYKHTATIHLLVAVYLLQRFIVYFHYCANWFSLHELFGRRIFPTWSFHPTKPNHHRVEKWKAKTCTS